LFYKKLLELYMNIKMPIQYQKITAIDGPIMFYQANQDNQFISSSFRNLSNYIIEIDISSSFPTICQQLYKNTNFLKKLNNIKEKKAKNIFISTTLNNNELKKLNLISKLIICGLIFDNEYKDSILIYELKKDSLLLSCNYKTYKYFQNIINDNMIPTSIFTNFILRHGFKFHMDEYLYYIRTHKTSIFYSLTNKMYLKGNFKYVPVKLQNIMVNIFKNNKLKEKDKKQLLKIYNNLYFKLIQYNNAVDILKQYYFCKDDMVITSDFKYSKFNSRLNINPQNYLKLFIFPILQISLN